MKRNTSIFWLFGMLVILFVSCQNTDTPIVTATPKSPINRWDSGLMQPICQPPCWQNITPGLTTINEAVSILEKTPELIITSKSEYGIDLAFAQNKTYSGTLSVSQDGIVRVIWLANPANINLFLETMVAMYDYPQYVKPYDCREEMCSTALVYPDLGMFLSVFIKNTGKFNNIAQIEILPNTVINRVYFIEPGIESFQNSLELQEDSLLMEWKGYGEYP